jgi:hypothetical protein
LSSISSRHCSVKISRGHDQHAPRRVAQQELLDDQPRLDRLAEADVVGDQQAHPGHLDRTRERVELVTLDLDAALERCEQLTRVRRRQRPPPDGIEERGESSGSSSRSGIGKPARLMTWRKSLDSHLWLTTKTTLPARWIWSFDRLGFRPISTRKSRSVNER